MQDDLAEGLLELEETLYILRETVHGENFGKVFTYRAIVDWYSEFDIESDINFSDDLSKFEKSTVKEVLAEMQKANEILPSE